MLDGFISVSQSYEGNSKQSFESRNHSHSTRFEMPRLEDLWDMEQYGSKTSGTWNSTAVRAPFDDQVTMATIYLSGDAKLWWRTRYEDVLEGRCKINAWEELKRELKERSSSCLGTLHGSHESPYHTHEPF